jgi:hypothetical protein
MSAGRTIAVLAALAAAGSFGMLLRCSTGRPSWHPEPGPCHSGC